MTDFLVAMLMSIFAGPGLNAVDQVAKSFETYSASAYSVAITINSLAVKPVAGVCLSAVMLIEFIRISSRVEGDQKLGVQLVGIALFKCAVIIAVIQNTQAIMKGINSGVQEMIKRTNAADTVGATNAISAETLREKLDELSTLEQLGLFPIMFIPWLLSIAVMVIVPIVVMYRFLEMYVLTAGASLPLVFLANPETKSMGIGYLRKFAAACLQGFTLLVAVRIYAAFQADSLKDMPDLGRLLSDFDFGNLVSNMATIVLGPMLLIVVVLASGRFAKALVGE